MGWFGLFDVICEQFMQSQDEEPRRGTWCDWGSMLSLVSFHHKGHLVVVMLLVIYKVKNLWQEY